METDLQYTAESKEKDFSILNTYHGFSLSKAGTGGPSSPSWQHISHHGRPSRQPGEEECLMLVVPFSEVKSAMELKELEEMM